MKNIILYFSDQQRWDTVNETVTPNLMKLAREGVIFKNNITCQPVCGPARACLQTGRYATQLGCYFNGIPLPENVPTLADYFNKAGYQTSYIGKWHLASDRFPGIGGHYEKTAIPKNKLGGYSYFRGADVLEFTSHGYDGFVFDENGTKINFKGYRADCINNFAVEFIKNRDKSKPFFMFVSQLEPHHQNDRHCYEGFKDTVVKFKDYPVPPDLDGLKGDYKKMYPDYISAINRLDYNVGRLVETLKEQGIYDDTVIIYTSDHGSHFKTRNAEYKRSCHEASVHTPLIIKGGCFTGGKTVDNLSSLIDLPSTLLSLADIDIPPSYMGTDLTKNIKQDSVFIQISEASNSRAIRTDRYKYSVRDIFPTGYLHGKAKVYVEDYLYDLQNDINERNNLVKDKNYDGIRRILRKELKNKMVLAGEKEPLILSAVLKRKV